MRQLEIEYKLHTLYTSDPGQIIYAESFINKMASKGWKLIAVNRCVHYFERNKDEASK